MELCNSVEWCYFFWKMILLIISVSKQSLLSDKWLASYVKIADCDAKDGVKEEVAFPTILQYDF